MALREIGIGGQQVGRVGRDREQDLAELPSEPRRELLEGLEALLTGPAVPDPPKLPVAPIQLLQEEHLVQKNAKEGRHGLEGDTVWVSEGSGARQEEGAALGVPDRNRHHHAVGLPRDLGSGFEGLLEGAGGE